MSSIMTKISNSQQSGSSKNNFNTIDSNGNGKLSVEELSITSSQSAGDTTASKLVSAADTDGDSELTPDELLAYLAQMMSSGLSGQNNVQLASSRNASGSSSSSANSIFIDSDKDKSGEISFDEFTASTGTSGSQAKDIFGKIDTNNDESLSEDEVAAFQEKMNSATSAGSSQDQLSKLLLDLIQSSKAASAEKSEGKDDAAILTAAKTSSSSASSSTNQSEEDEIFNYFDQDGDGVVSDTELDTGMQSLKTAMQNYMISMQENRAAL
jgi:Ca2+-binding EF-hand superfamily protein